MSKLLFDSQPLVIDPALAVKIGLNEAIFIQQIHYWIEVNKRDNKNNYDGYHWTYNSYPEWQKQFPFWSEATIKRTVYRLESKGLLVSSNYNKRGFDKTKWYRIDYDKLNQITSGQNDTTSVSNCYDDHVKMIRPIPETTTETTTEINNNNGLVADATQTTYTPYLDSLLFYYFDRFKQFRKYKHPRLIKEQRERVKQTLSLFISDYGITDKEIKRMIDGHFDRVNKLKRSDYNINHFVTEGIMMNLYYSHVYNQEED